jgi:hypothetical protein
MNLSSRSMVKSLAAGLFFCCAAPSYALINGQLLLGLGVGKSNFEGSLTDHSGRQIKGNSLSASVFVDPFPLVPIAFGLGVSAPKNQFRDNLDNLVTYTGYAFDAEVLVWSPLSLSDFTPYLRVGHVFAGRYTLKHDIKNAVTVDGFATAAGGQNEYQAGVRGNLVGIGLQYRALPMVAIGGELRWQADKLTINKMKVDGSEVSASLPQQSQRQMQVLAGVNVGI